MHPADIARSIIVCAAWPSSVHSIYYASHYNARSDPMVHWCILPIYNLAMSENIKTLLSGRSGPVVHITMCLRVLRDALFSQVEYFRLRRSRGTASERAMVRASPVVRRATLYYQLCIIASSISMVDSRCQYFTAQWCISDFTALVKDSKIATS